MIRLFIISTIFLLRTTSIFACCAEKDYRLFPIGELNQEIVFIEFDMFRNCKMGTGGGENNEFWIHGTIQLVQTSGEGITLIQTIDTINIVECRCTYKDYYSKTEYEIKLADSYKKALEIVRNKKGFVAARPKGIAFNDTLNTKFVEESSDSTYSQILTYKDTIVIDLGVEDIISCYPDKVAEVRSYQTDNFNITILRLRCELLDEQAQTHNKKRFNNIETAFWKEQAQWHGIAKDYIIIRK